MPAFDVEFVYNIEPKSYHIYSHYLCNGKEMDEKIEDNMYPFGENVHLKFDKTGYTFKSLKIINYKTKEDVLDEVNYEDGKLVMPNYDIEIIYEYEKIENKVDEVITPSDSKVEEIENPETGQTFPVILLLCLFLIGIFGLKFSKKVFYKL